MLFRKARTFAEEPSSPRPFFQQAQNYESSLDQEDDVQHFLDF